MNGQTTQMALFPCIYQNRILSNDSGKPGVYYWKPLFEEVKIHPGEGKTFTWQTENKYVQKAF